MAKQRYKVCYDPSLSDEKGVAYIMVIGPDSGHFAIMPRIAEILETAINSAANRGLLTVDADEILFKIN